MEELKKRLDVMFNFSSLVNYQEDHLLPILQASKSLIGLSPKSPSVTILKWLEKQVKNYKITNHTASIHNTNPMPEMISTFHFFKLIKSKNKIKSKKYLMSFLQVSDPKYLMELIFEISFTFSFYKILFCWFALKTVKIMKPEESCRVLFLCIDCLFSKNKKEYNSDLYKFYFLSYSYHMKSMQFVRSNNIYPLVIKKLQSINKSILIEEIVPKKMLNQIKGNDVNSISKYISTLKDGMLSSKDIFVLDAIRSLLQNNFSKNDMFNLKNIFYVK